MFIGFVSLFTLEVFSQGYGFWRTLFTFRIYLSPSLVMVAALLLAWRWGVIGAVAFTLSGAFFIANWQGAVGQGWLRSTLPGDGLAILPQLEREEGTPKTGELKPLSASFISIRTAAPRRSRAAGKAAPSIHTERQPGGCHSVGRISDTPVANRWLSRRIQTYNSGSGGSYALFGATA